MMGSLSEKRVHDWQWSRSVLSHLHMKVSDDFWGSSKHFAPPIVLPGPCSGSFILVSMPFLHLSSSTHYSVGSDVQ